MNYLNHEYDKFNGERLKLARRVRNITLQELAEKMKKSHQAISKYENGKSSPSSDDVMRLSYFLKFEPSFFYLKGSAADLEDNSFIFRSKASVAKKYKEQVEATMILIKQFVEKIEFKVSLPPFDKTLIEKNVPYHAYSEEEIESLAINVRGRFGLGSGPIINLTALCERMGIIIVFMNFNSDGIDACSGIVNNRPYIVLNKDRLSSVRIRFNIAHELGHILLHLKYDKNIISNKNHSKSIEREAHQFASSLLMPEEGIVGDLTALGLDYLVTLKRHWLVSIQAIIYRAEQLGIFTADYALYLRQQISRKKWRTVEPLDDKIPKEKPKLLSYAVEYLEKEKHFFISQLSFLTGITEDEILLFCSREQRQTNVIQLNK
ncbi:MAG: ImmA/IrrE family metallo-endopeptidase [Sporolactobacillus sp.]|uniref:ImmA/IrrE family metallo-endopeptidase n=1 Tax=Sporolactobacillus sp. STSJ-5 TaxID=2965076 RepID=UPI0021053430|nr:ImmA/IrrE family metallo-endopeptidase [Sporolactobacillus sp. STSJ-5]MCQ2009284.1 ImmA/IrrE family metallo-endopeptidase [Sporolactobacillus sp. STSJ-5]